MAPIPAADQPNDQSPPKEEGKSWTTATIVVGAVFLFLAVTFIVTIVIFCIHKRKLRNKLPADKRPRSYHPFRTETAYKSVATEATTPDDERSSMFSRERTSVSLYVQDAPMNKRISTETVNLIPLHVPQPETPASMTGQISSGSGVSALSSRYSRGSMSLSPIQQREEEEGDLAARPARPRSTSTTSMRYYGKNTNSSDRIALPQLPMPKIVDTPPA